MIDLWKVGFPEMMDKRLRKRLEEDISKFELRLGDTNKEINVSVNRSIPNKNIYVLNCGYISRFKFPNGSNNNEFRNMGPKATKIDHIMVNLHFNYNYKNYIINGFI